MSENENENEPPKDLDTDYGADAIQHLSDVEHVRLRPGMYVGDVAAQGLHHLVYELVDNAIDEVMGGHAKSIVVMINNDGSVSVEDDGRGIPATGKPRSRAKAQHSRTKRSSLSCVWVRM